jgi:hypothetical protein
MNKGAWRAVHNLGLKVRHKKNVKRHVQKCRATNSRIVLIPKSEMPFK